MLQEKRRECLRGLHVNVAIGIDIIIRSRRLGGATFAFATRRAAIRASTFRMCAGSLCDAPSHVGGVVARRRLRPNRSSKRRVVRVEDSAGLLWRRRSEDRSEQSLSAEAVPCIAARVACRSVYVGVTVARGEARSSMGRPSWSPPKRTTSTSHAPSGVGARGAAEPGRGRWFTSGGVAAGERNGGRRTL